MADITPGKLSFANKSWVEMYEEEHPEEENEREYINNDNLISKDNINSVQEMRRVYEEKPHASCDIGDTLDLWPDEESRLSGIGSPMKPLKTPPKDFSTYANVLKKYSPENTKFGSNISELEPRKLVKREIQKDFLQEDLSLTSHLDVFHMQSPCKPSIDTDRCKQETAKDIACDENINEDFPKLSEKRRIPLRQVGSEHTPTRFKKDKHSIPDDVLMPSPSKMIRSFGNDSEHSPRNMVLESRKRQRESYSSNRSGRKRDSFSSPAHKKGDSFSSPANKKNDSVSSPSSRNDDIYETDAAILSRRQKQIDYGKNTVGYELYTTQVPRDKREKNHPKTPPRHLKYSRRAWDGLVKNWRRRLHYWDPPSEGGGDPALLEDMNESEISGNESYSLPNSVPSTPQQDSKRWKGKESEESGFDFEFDNDLYVVDSIPDEEEEEDFKPLDCA